MSDFVSVYTFYNKNNTQMTRFTIDYTNEGQRITKFLLKNLEGVSKAMVFKLLRKGEVKIERDGKKQKAKGEEMLKKLDVVLVFLPKDFQSRKVAPKNFKLKKGEVEMIFEDEDLMIVNKPAGLASHGGSKHQSDNLIGRVKANMGIAHESRVPALVNRIDFETSGLVVIAKNEKTAVAMGKIFENREIDKKYIAVVAGNITPEYKKWTTLLDEMEDKETGKMLHAESLFKVRTMRRTGSIVYGLAEINLLTGRMHQIRKQLANRKMYIVGDKKYGDFGLNREFETKFGVKRMLLHSQEIKFQHFREDKKDKVVHIKSPTPEEFKQVFENA